MVPASLLGTWVRVTSKHLKLVNSPLQRQKGAPESPCSCTPRCLDTEGLHFCACAGKERGEEEEGRWGWVPCCRRWLLRIPMVKAGVTWGHSSCGVLVTTASGQPLTCTLSIQKTPGDSQGPHQPGEEALKQDMGQDLSLSWPLGMGHCSYPAFVYAVGV